MADDALRRIDSTINTATQLIRHEIKRAASQPANESLPRIALHIADALDPEGASADKNAQHASAQSAVLRPIALGLKAGAIAGHVYGQGAKFLFGRGERMQADGGFTAPVAFAQHGPEAQKAARHAHNMQALKQDGVLGLAVHALAQGVGNLVGAAFCGGEAEANKLSERITQGTRVLNAGARTLLLGAPMVAAVVTGTLVGLMAAAGVASYKGAKALHAHYSASASKAQNSAASAASDASEAKSGIEQGQAEAPAAGPTQSGHVEHTEPVESAEPSAPTDQAQSASATQARQKPHVHDMIYTLYRYAGGLCEQQKNGTPPSEQQKALLYERFADIVSDMPDALPEDLHAQVSALITYVTDIQENKAPDTLNPAL